MMIITESNLQYMPLTKELLINYIIHKYQEDAVTTADYLVQEYNLLAKNGELHFLNEGEYVWSQQRCKDENENK